ncbi:M23 family metallopeptidase [Couchioplanes azureus]|uniref:M23 family metallopeptidase n=1 Tax=Couchioplanes caeruleus TaxID=56438 RepID=UPI001670E1DA|nr:M23 family metallopeptidase [Couchioplanes caeruleus]GGQ75873.1 hypothetical protein GCM10010166_52520 [Couchioplanes caeruleus subsp. azureus]
MRVRSFRLVTAFALALAGVAAALPAPAPGHAAGPRPLFQLPFTCGQQWTASTRSDHIPNPNSLDLMKVGGGSNNQPILAAAGGRVVKSAYDDGGGWHVRIDHGNGWQTRYLHMISAPAVSLHQTVVQGQLIGRVGSTGDSGAPHLHFEQIQDGTTVRSAFDGQLVTVEVGRSQVLTSRNCGGGGTPDLGVLDFFLSDDPASGVNTRPVIHYGNSPMIPVVGDWNGDGTDTVSAYDPTGGRFLLSNDPATGAAQYSFAYGNPGAVPLVGDWDGDGRDNVGVRMGNTFYLRTSPVTSGTETTVAVAYGDPADTPLIGDWDGDGIGNLGVTKPGSNLFYLRTSANNQPEATRTVAYGNPGALPLVGDWDGDGKDNIGVRMGNGYYFRTSAVTDGAEVTHHVAYGNGDGREIPIVGDWNGDKRDTQGIVF